MPYTEKLPSFVIAGLFKNVLISIDKATQFTEKNPYPEIKNKGQKEFDFLGKNVKNILLVVKENDEEIIIEPRKNILLKILSACTLTLDDVAIVNLNNCGKSFEKIREKFSPEKILLFDVTTKEIGLPFTIPHYQVQQYDGCMYISAPGVTLENDNGNEKIKAEKKKLWVSLKKIFLEK